MTAPLYRLSKVASEILHDSSAVSDIIQQEESLVMSNNHTPSSTVVLKFLIYHFNYFMELKIIFLEYCETMQLRAFSWNLVFSVKKIVSNSYSGV